MNLVTDMKLIVLNLNKIIDALSSRLKNKGTNQLVIRTQLRRQFARLTPSMLKGILTVYAGSDDVFFRSGLAYFSTAMPLSILYLLQQHSFIVESWC